MGHSLIGRRAGRLTIRVRMTLWYIVLLAIILAAFSAFLYISLKRGLTDQAHTVLSSHAEQIASKLEIEDGRLGREEGMADRPAGTIAALYDSSGKRLIAFGGSTLLPARLTPPSGNQQAKPRLRQIRLQDELWLGLIQPIGENERIVAWLLTARSMKPVEAALHRLLLIIAAGIPLTLLVAVLGGLFLAQRMLSPIDRITRTAAGIAKGDLSRRLGWSDTNDEVGRLAATFDDMLDTIEGFVSQQRQFTADASHELRTPLAVVTAESDDLLSRPHTNEEYRDALKHIHGQSQRMRQLVNDLLFLARADSETQRLEHEVVHLSNLVECVLEEMRGLAGKTGVELEGDIHPELFVKGDQSRLTQLLLNLIDNALTYTPAGGHVWVKLRRAAGQNRLKPPQKAPRSEEFINLIVEDTGYGIPADQIPLIFERFYRVDKARSRPKGGSGLGLAIVRWIVEAHEGTIHVESQVGVGTTFIISLPLAPT